MPNAKNTKDMMNELDRITMPPPRFIPSNSSGL